MDKNVIFVYPLNALLIELKKELEKDASFSVLEVDMLSEYEPLIQSISYSITFSSDVKKTAMFLEVCKKYTKEINHLNILISKQTPSGLVLSRLEKDGLNEFLGDFTKLNTIMVKINHFYKDFVTKVVTDFSMENIHTNKIDTVSEQRIERLIIEDIKPKASPDEDAEPKPAIELKEIDSNESRNVVQNKLESHSASPNDSLDRSTIPYNIKTKGRPASDWMGLEQTDNEKMESLESSTHSKKELPLLLGTAALPEITFFPALRIFDPIAFYMEILWSKSDSDFKRKYLKMCLLKVYHAQLYIADSAGVWEESTPASLQLFNSAEKRGPTWINEGRDEFENLFIMPIIFDDAFLGGIGLVIPGQINHEKMLEMEFWCYLGRCLCS